MKCPKCSGYMFTEWVPGGHHGPAIEVFKCVNCGEEIDDVILNNRDLNERFDRDTGDYDSTQ